MNPHPSDPAPESSGTPNAVPGGPRRQSPRPFQLSPRHRAVVFAVFAVLFSSGFTWWIADEAAEEAGRSVAWADAAKPWLMRVHGAAVMAFLVSLGTVLMVHVRRAWPSRVNHRTGLLLSGWLLLQMVTGYGLYYFGGDKLRDWTGTIHVTLGLLSPVVFGGHVAFGRWLLRRRSPR